MSVWQNILDVGIVAEQQVILGVLFLMHKI